MSGGGGKQPSKTTQTQELPAWAIPYAKEVLAKGSALTDINSNPYVKYGGERLAGFNPMQQQSFAGARNMSVAPQIGQATQYAMQSGQYSPVGQQYTGSNVGQYMNPFLENALAPQLRKAAEAGRMAQQQQAAKAVGMGAFGGTRGALQQSMVDQNTRQNLSDINAQGYSDAFNQAAGMFNTDQARRIQEAQFGNSAKQQAAGLLAQLGGQQFQQGMDINKLQNTYGAQQQSQAQKAADIGYQDFLDQQNYAYKQLGFMSDLIKNPAIGSSTQRQMYENNSGNDLATLGGLGALGKGAGLFKEGGMVGYADGGDITSYVKRLSDDQLAAALKQAQQDQDQERIMALTAEMQYRQEVRGAQAMPQEQPMDQGLAALPAGPMPQMASGGIVAFASGGTEGKDDKKKETDADRAAYRAYALAQADARGLPRDVVDAILQQESGYKAAAKNPASSATGIGQLIHPTGKSLGLKDDEFTDPYKNIDASLTFMSTLNKKYGGDPEKIAMAYHDGEPVADKHLKANKGEVNRAQLKPAAQDYLAKTADKVASVGAVQATAPAEPVSAVSRIPSNYVDPRQNFMGPAAPPPRDRDFGGLGRALGAVEGFGSLASVLPAIPIGLLKTALSEDNKSFEQNFNESVYSPRTDTGQGVVRGVGEVMEALKIPPMPFMTGAAASTRGVSAAQRAAKEAEAAAALAGKRVATPRLASIPEDTSVMGKMRSGLADITRRDADQASAARLGEEAKIAPLKVQNEMLRAGDQATNTLYGQGVANRAARAGLTGLGATAAANASQENMPSGLAAAVEPIEPVDPEDLSKDEKKDVVDAAKKAVPDSMKKGSGFTNDDWLMLGLQMLKNNVGQKGFGQILGESGLPTLMNKKEREKMEREQESQGFVDEYRQSQAELNRAQADYYSGLKGPQAALTLGQTNHKNWLGTMAGKMATPEVAAAHERESIANAFRSLGLSPPAGMMAAPAPEVTNFKKVG